MAETRIAGMNAESGRWLYVAIGLLMNLCLGAVYAFSVFRLPLESTWGISATQSGLPFMVFLAMFALFMALAGGLVGRWGARKTALLGGVLVGAGWILSGFATNIALLTVFYGGIAGAGVGIIYGCPIAVSAKWFPDKKGIAVGLTVMGFGLSALIMVPLMTRMINNPAVGALGTFKYLGIAFLAVLVLLSLPLRMPAADWRPRGWTGGGAGGDAAGVDIDRKQMVRTSTFYALWGTYAIGCLAGLMAIGIAKPFGEEILRAAGYGDVRMQSLLTTMVALFAVFNGVGRPLFGWLTDKLNPRRTAVLSFVLILVASALLYLLGNASPVLYFIAFAVLYLNLGGWLAIAPTATATLFGTTHYGKNYGLVFTSYGVGAIAGMLLSGVIKDATGAYLPVFLPVMALAAFGAIVAWLGLKPVRAASR
ncbi:OFA family MFS transporter [Candidatus Bipolaricaulota bacterium]|nr:OFA family MFS transporter [Candidatus Bipolaricaulota bacterium]